MIQRIYIHKYSYIRTYTYILVYSPLLRPQFNPKSMITVDYNLPHKNYFKIKNHDFRGHWPMRQVVQKYHFNF